MNANSSTHVRRPMPSDLTKTEEGRNIAHNITLEAKKSTWSESLKRGKRKAWFQVMVTKWFQDGDIFDMYKHINCDEVQRKFGVFEKYAKTEAQRTHSSDPTGELGEVIPESISVLVKFIESNSSNTTPLARSQNRATERALTETMAPLGANSQAKPRSEIARENVDDTALASMANANIMKASRVNHAPAQGKQGRDKRKRRAIDMAMIGGDEDPALKVMNELVKTLGNNGASRRKQSRLQSLQEYRECKKGYDEAVEASPQDIRSKNFFEKIMKQIENEMNEENE